MDVGRPLVVPPGSSSLLLASGIHEDYAPAMSRGYVKENVEGEWRQGSSYFALIREADWLQILDGTCLLEKGWWSSRVAEVQATTFHLVVLYKKLQRRRDSASVDEERRWVWVRW